LGLSSVRDRQALDVPISGPVVEIDPLSENQQMEIARSLRGSQGEAILDQRMADTGGLEN
jgi:hypothetical protein